MLKINDLHKFCKFIEKTNWLEEYDFWLLGSFPKVVQGELPEANDIDVAVVNKNNHHDKNKISDILSKCVSYRNQKLDIYYRPGLNYDLKNRGLDAIWTSTQFWGAEKTWPTKETYQGWRVKNYRPLELWYLLENKIQITYKLWPLEKHIERVIDGHIYAKPILLNNYIKEEKHHGRAK